MNYLCDRNNKQSQKITTMKSSFMCHLKEIPVKDFVNGSIDSRDIMIFLPKEKRFFMANHMDFDVDTNEAIFIFEEGVGSGRILDHEIRVKKTGKIIVLEKYTVSEKDFEKKTEEVMA